MKRFTTILILLLVIQASAQKSRSSRVKIQWGNELKESRKETLEDIVAYDETGIYALKSRVRGLAGSHVDYSLEHYDNNMNQVKSTDLELKYDNRDMDLEFLIHFNGVIYLFSSYKNQKEKINILFIQTIDKQTLMPKGDRMKIAQISYAGKSKLNSGVFNYAISRDSSKLLVFYGLSYDKGSKEKFGFHVFDRRLSPLWNKDITLPYNVELFDVVEFKINNEGNVYLLGRIFKEKRKEKRRGEVNYKYQVLNYYNNGSSLKEFPVQVPGKYLSEMQIAINNDDEIICSGFFSDEGAHTMKNIHTIKGCYFLKIDNDTKEIKAKSFKDFSIDFITQYMKENQAERVEKRAEKGKNVELFEYDLDDIVLRDDGGALLVGEQFYIHVIRNTYTDANGIMHTTVKYVYHYNNIIAISISPEGNIDWAQKIPKKQVTTNDGGFYSSYAMAVCGDKIYFIYNDNPKNVFEKREDKIYFFNGSKKAIVTLATLNVKGELTKEALFALKDADIITRPKVCEQVSKNEMIIFGQRKKTHKFAKLTFAD